MDNNGCDISKTGYRSLCFSSKVQHQNLLLVNELNASWFALVHNSIKIRQKPLYKPVRIIFSAYFKRTNWHII
jgi:hypothetical protein